MWSDDVFMPMTYHDLSTMDAQEKDQFKEKLNDICDRCVRNMNRQWMFVIALADVFVDSPEGYFLYELGNLDFYHAPPYFFRKVAKATCGGRKPQHVSMIYDVLEGKERYLTAYEWKISGVKFVFKFLSQDEARRRRSQHGWILETITPEEESEWSEEDTDDNESDDD